MTEIPEKEKPLPAEPPRCEAGKYVNCPLFSGGAGAKIELQALVQVRTGGLP